MTNSMSILHGQYDSVDDSWLVAFSKSVKLFPHECAILFDGKRVSYSLLDSWSNWIAEQINKINSGTQFIAVYMERSPEMIAAMIGIHKAGKAYLPIDPMFPEKRISYMLESSEANICISSGKSIENTHNINTGIQIIDINHLQKSNYVNNYTIKPESPAYILFTSGSTGSPKGVVIPHGAFSNFLTSMSSSFVLGPGNKVLALTTISFDISGLEIFLPLITGACVFLVDKETTLQPSVLLKSIEKENIDLIQATPATWRMLLQEGLINGNGKVFLCGGEAFPPELCNTLLDTGADVWNMYGPTETTIWSSLEKMSPELASDPPIGNPIFNTGLHILDENFIPVKEGDLGELYISGKGLALGYYKDEEKTRERFIIPSNSNRTFYRTGDLVQISGGKIRFRGRVDTQLKIRGFRIEAGEIETLIFNYSDYIRNCVVLGQKDPLSNDILVAFLQCDEPVRKNIDIQNLKIYLSEHLPGYMIPTQFSFLNDFPKTPNQKIDRKSFPDASLDIEAVSAKASIKENSDVKEIIRDIWSKVLNYNTFSDSDNFFDIGGHSLLLVEVHRRITEIFGEKLTMTDLLGNPTVHHIADTLLDGGEEEAFLENLSQQEGPFEEEDEYALAIIGYSCAVPGASNIEEFWELLEEGRCAISEFTKDELLAEGISEEVINNPNYVFKSGYLPEAKYFDADFFGYSPQEARFMDPQHRVFLEHVYKALESACVIPDSFIGKIGVFAGCGQNQYLYKNIIFSKERENWSEFQTMIGNDKDFLATRAAYKLNLRGPAVTVQTACSTSLVALNMAYQSLISYQSDVAVCGAVSINIPLKQGYEYMDGSIFSPYGECRTFDKDASGTLFGSGVCTLVIKRYNDAIKDKDYVLAKITGISINNDGSKKVSYTAPGVDGQTDVIASAIDAAGISARDVSYVEAHGTGTKLGDPIEISALTKVFRKYTQEKQFCHIGSVKPNIGHLDAAAGLAGVIKTVLSFQKNVIPKSLNYSSPNPEMNIENSPFRIASENVEWSTEKKKIAGVSAFGIGGTNAHVILEESSVKRNSPNSLTSAIIPVTAKSKESLEGTINSLGNYLEKSDINIADVLYTQLNHRKQYKHKGCLYISGQTIERIIPEENDNNDREIIFMFSGQGSQYSGMGRYLYEWHPFIKKSFNDCFSILESMVEWNPKSIMFDQEFNISQTEFTQPLLFTFEYVIACFFIHIGISPNHLIGHSLGEITAACIGGALTLREALYFVVARGKILQTAPSGSMAAVLGSRKEIEPLLLSDVTIAGDNSTLQTVISGSVEDVKDAADMLRKKKYKVTDINAHTGFHSKVVSECVPKLKEVVDSIEFKPLETSIYSNVTGGVLQEGYVFDAEYWLSHMCSTVRFREGLLSIPDSQSKVFVEIGPGSILSGLVQQIFTNNKSILPGIAKHGDNSESEIKSLIYSIASLFSYGYVLNWNFMYDLSGAGKVYLPGYVFKKEMHWITPDSALTYVSARKESIDAFTIDMNSTQNLSTLEKIRNIWGDLLGYTDIPDDLDFFESGGDSLSAARLIQNVNSCLGTDLSLGYIFSHSVFSEFLAQNNWEVFESSTNNDTYIFNLNHSSKEKKIYCVLGVQIYQELANELKDTAQCYGMYIPEEESFFGDKFSRHELSVQDLASVYKKLIIQHNGKRPLSILGLSFGGLVAYELARQLVDSGIVVNRLIMLDSLLPSGMRKDFFPWIKVQLKHLLAEGLQKRVKLLFKIFNKSSKQNNHSIDFRMQNYGIATNKYEETFCFKKYNKAAFLIKAAKTVALESDGYTIMDNYGWEHYIEKKNIENVKIQGSHLSILIAPYVQCTADVIKQNLTKKKTW